MTQASDLRQWQAEGLDVLLASVRRGKSRFLVTATPGAGKTTFGLAFADALRAADLIDYVGTVAPTKVIRNQWQQAAGQRGFDLGRTVGERDGDVATYAMVDGDSEARAAGLVRRRALITLDECHHGGDYSSWGLSLKTAFDQAAFILNLSGTPFRSDRTAIPFVEYDAHGVSVADYAYDYARAISDGVCRPVIFNPEDFTTPFRGSPTDSEMAEATRTSLDPVRGIVGNMVRAADADLTEKRRKWPDAAGLLICMTQAHAKACADIIEAVTGTRPRVVISDSETAEHDLTAFRDGTDRWIVAVKMISEGVDIPRLMTLVYASNIVSTLFFRQVVGRIVRVRNKGDDETGSVYLPRDDRMMKEAADIEKEVRMAIITAPTRFARARTALGGSTKLLTNRETFRPVYTEQSPQGFNYSVRYTPA